jgi:hypothetical protein
MALDNAEVSASAQEEQTGIQQDKVALDPFYVVSVRKFFILYLVTFGLYRLYWFYKNWRLHSAQPGSEKVWPWARAIFSIFFTHSLFGYVEDRLSQKGEGQDWKLNDLASMVVGVAIVHNIIDRMANKDIGSPVTDIISILLIFFSAALLSKAQRAVNVACGDSEGKTNNNLTAGNYVWIVIGAIVWILGLIGIFG